MQLSQTSAQRGQSPYACLRNIHAHFHHSGGHQNLAAAGGEIPQHLLFLSTAEATMQQTDRH